MIDQLWCYISDGLVQMSLGNDFKTYFPDDPAWIGFELDRDSRTAKLSVYTGTLKQATLEARSLIAGFSEAAVFFFEWLIARFPEDRGRVDSYAPQLEAMRTLALKASRR